jgi:pimeloyl-ACP methyl ester carboxylesterase
MGGRVGWRIAAAYPERVAALAAFHAGGVGDFNPDDVSGDQREPGTTLRRCLVHRSSYPAA